MDANGIPAKHFQEMERRRFERIEATDNTAELEELTGGLASENMTVRDEFAKTILKECLKSYTQQGIYASNEEIAKKVFGLTDAMMAERNKRGN